MDIDKLTAQQRQALSIVWVREIMRPVLVTGLLETIIRLGGDDSDASWIADACGEWHQCPTCEGEGEIDRGDTDDCDSCEDGDANYMDEHGDYIPCEHCGDHDCPDCDSGQIHAPVYEYWLVSDRAAARIADDDLLPASDLGIGNSVWLRRGTGQAIGLDSDIESAALEYTRDCPHWVEPFLSEIMR